jgi:hypothetical protein
MEDHAASEKAMSQFTVGILIIHIINAYYMTQGSMDRYVLAVMIDQALLGTAAQAIHFLRHRRWSKHRLIFNFNVIWTLIEFICACAPSSRIDENKNLCPDVKTAIAATQNERIKATIPLLVVAILLAIADLVVYRIDKRRNSARQRGDPVIGFRPRVFTWDKGKPTVRKFLYFGLAIAWVVYSIFSMEWFVIRDLHVYTQNFNHVSSDENSWGAGQIIAVLTTLSFSGFTLGEWLKRMIKKGKL